MLPFQHQTPADAMNAYSADDNGTTPIELMSADAARDLGVTVPHATVYGLYHVINEVAPRKILPDGEREDGSTPDVMIGIVSLGD